MTLSLRSILVSARWCIVALVLGYFVFIGGPLPSQVNTELKLITWAFSSLVIGVWIVVRLFQRARLPRTALDLPWAGLLLAFLIASALSLHPRLSLGLTGLVIGYVLAYYLVVDLAQNGWDEKVFMPALFAVGGGVLILVLIELQAWLGLWRSIGGDAHPWPPTLYRLVSIFAHANSLASFLILASPLVLIYWIVDRRPLQKALYTVWLAAAALAMFFTSSRGGWIAGSIALAVSLAVGFYPRRAEIWQQIKTLWRLPVAKLIAVIGFIAFAIAALVLFRLAGRVINEVGSHGNLLESRSEYWPLAWRAFLSSPIVGTGPSTFFHQFFTQDSVSAKGVYTLPHSVLFGVLAEEGLLGLAAAVWMLVAGTQGLISQLRRAEGERRFFLAGVAGAWVGLVLHSLTGENAVLFPVGLLWTLAAGVVYARTGEIDQRRSWPIWVLAPLAIALGGGCLYSVRALLPFKDGLNAAASEDWPRAANRLEAAAAADPTFAFYRFQAGYAWARAGETERAIAQYEAGLSLEPDYASNWVNIALLYQQSRQYDKALAAYGRAIELTPDVGAFWLNRGALLESLGQLGEAKSDYIQALDLIPGWSESQYWQATSERQTVLTEWKANYQPALSEGDIALQSGDYDAALTAYTAERIAQPFLSAPYVGLGETYWAKGDLSEAEYNFAVGAQMRGDPFVLHLRWSELAEARGDLTAAIDRAWHAFTMIEDYNLYGPGSLGANNYGIGVYSREGIRSEFLPALLRLDLTPAVASRFNWLASQLRAAGHMADAKRLDAWLEQAP